MSHEHIWDLLQRFAEGGDGGSSAGGEGAPAGVSPDDAGRARLLALGVPEGKITKRAGRAVGKRMDAFQPGTNAQAAAVQEEKPKPNPQGQAESQTPGEGPAKTEDGGQKRLSWKEITEDPEYNAELQKTIQGRLRKAKGAEESMAKLGGALEVLARKYGMEMEGLDYEKLGKAIEEDASLDEQYYQDLAKKSGVSVETARVMDRQSREKERIRKADEMTARETAMAQHFAKLEQQAQELKKVYPGFDLREAMADDRFARAVGPGGGLSVEQAYTAFHWKEIQAAQNEVVAKQLREEMARSIQSNRNRPQELGTNSAAPSVATFDWRNAPKEQYREMVNRIKREGKVRL